VLLFVSESKHTIVPKPTIDAITIKQSTFALNYREISDKLKELETKYNKQFNDGYEAKNFLLQKEKQETGKRKRKQIGYKIEKNGEK
jgi:hypothetical protein